MFEDKTDPMDVYDVDPASLLDEDDGYEYVRDAADDEADLLMAEFGL